MACKCQGCGSYYSVDFLVPDDVWEKIRPEGSHDGGGFLCGHCIVTRIGWLCEDGPEYGPNEYGAWELICLLKKPKLREEVHPKEDGWIWFWILVSIAMLCIVLAIIWSR